MFCYDGLVASLRPHLCLSFSVFFFIYTHLYKYVQFFHNIPVAVILLTVYIEIHIWLLLLILRSELLCFHVWHDSKASMHQNHFVWLQSKLIIRPILLLHHHHFVASICSLNRKKYCINCCIFGICMKRLTMFCCRNENNICVLEPIYGFLWKVDVANVLIIGSCCRWYCYCCWNFEHFFPS